MAERSRNSDITETAALWIARLDSGEMSAEQLIELRDWATASPAHMRELERLADIWQGLDRLTALQPIMTKPRPARHWSLRYPAVAASLAAVSILTALLYFTNQDRGLVEFEQGFVTGIGEQQTIQPGEGSIIDLNTNSGLDVEYSIEQRLVRLTHGEAFFDVEAADNRPFVVETEFGNVVVTGTAFLVRLDEAGMEVVVEEGSVQLENSADGNDADATFVTGLGAGELARLDSGGRRSIEPIDPVVMVRRRGWRDGTLSFEGESLEEIVGELSRYTQLRITIDDPELRQKGFGGFVRIGGADDILASLADFGIEVTRVDENEVRLAVRRD